MDERKETAIDYRKMQEAADERNLNNILESFFARWKPEDERDQNMFHAEFHSVVRSIYREAGKPAHEQMMKLMGAIPPLFPSKLQG